MLFAGETVRAGGEICRRRWVAAGAPERKHPTAGRARSRPPLPATSAGPGHVDRGRNRRGGRRRGPGPDLRPPALATRPSWGSRSAPAPLDRRPETSRPPASTALPYAAVGLWRSVRSARCGTVTRRRRPGASYRQGGWWQSRAGQRMRGDVIAFRLPHRGRFGRGADTRLLPSDSSAGGGPCRGLESTPVLSPGETTVRSVAQAVRLDGDPERSRPLPCGQAPNERRCGRMSWGPDSTGLPV
ncbi:UNVERIFIED_ORG: hypothetical protein EDC92_11928 [Dietzia maris]